MSISSRAIHIWLNILNCIIYSLLNVFLSPFILSFFLCQSPSSPPPPLLLPLVTLHPVASLVLLPQWSTGTIKRKRISPSIDPESCELPPYPQDPDLPHPDPDLSHPDLPYPGLPYPGLPYPGLPYLTIRLGGIWKIMELLDEGGFGKVYRVQVYCSYMWPDWPTVLLDTVLYQHIIDLTNAALKIESIRMDGGSAIKLEVRYHSWHRARITPGVRDTVVLARYQVIPRRDLIDVPYPCQRSALERIHEKGTKEHVPMLYRSSRRKNINYMIVTLLGDNLRRIKVR